MEMYLNKIKMLIQNNPFIVMGLMGCMLLLVLVLVVNTDQSPKYQENNAIKRTIHEDVGIQVGDTEKLEFMKGLQKDYFNFEDRVKSMEGQVKDIKKVNRQLKKEQKLLLHSLAELKEQMFLSQDSHRDAGDARLELAVAPIKELNAQTNDIYLPIGSFCRGTLMTGVYASSDMNSPLPVLISLDEAFYGPNKTRIPLKGAFVMGKAYGDINSERALIQIMAISLVLPDGRVFEHEQDIGYVTDEWGELGIKGRVMHNTGKALAVTFLGGFMSGGSSALANSETSSVQGRFGSVERNVTGDVGQHALFTGMAKSAGDLSQYYEKQADKIVPAVHIPSGQSVYFVVQKGVTINGFQYSTFNVLPISR